MDDSELSNTLSNLQTKVSQFSASTGSTYSHRGFFQAIDPRTKPALLYVLIPVSTGLLLFLWKPSFIMHEVVVDGELPQHKINVPKLLVVVLIVSIMLGLLFFTYQRKRKTALTTNET